MNEKNRYIIQNINENIIIKIKNGEINMKHKIVCILVGMLMFATVFSVALTANNPPKTSREASALDLAFINEPDAVGVFLNDGFGNFSSSGTSLPAGFNAVDMVTDDFNNDGILDLAVVHYGNYGGGPSVLLGDGLGGFSPNSPSGYMRRARYIASGDFNTDGDVDVAVTTQHQYSRTIQIAFGDGLGGFSGGKTLMTTTIPYGVATGDFDNDGDLDVATARSSSNDIAVFFGNGLGNFGSMVNYPAGISPQRLVVADFNNDVFPDIAVTNNYGDDITILINDEFGGFDNATNYAVGDAPNSIVAGDFDNDGNVDLAVTNYNDDDVTVLLGDGSGVFGSRTDYPVGDAPNSIVAGDFDVNAPPYIPSDPSPENGVIDVNISMNLSWTGGDPNPWDTVTYDVYFGTTDPPLLLEEDILVESFNPGTLNNGLIYYWKIVSWDNHGNSTIGPVWNFTTIPASNDPPNKPLTPEGDIYGYPYIAYSYCSNTTDPEDEDIFYMFDWGDGEFSEWLGPYLSGEGICENHTWSNGGMYDIRVQAKDIHDDIGEWSDPLSVHINSPPRVPNKPSAPGSTIPGQICYIVVQVPFDPEGDDVFILVDFGDGNDSGWLGPNASGTGYEVATHAWYDQGFYDVRAKAKDIYYEESEWSDPQIVHLNLPPEKPQTPTGETNGLTNVEYEYCSSSIDPGDKIQRYQFIWGDDSTLVWGPFDSGEEVCLTHAWAEPGVYNVTVRAFDEYNAYNLSDPLVVTISDPAPELNVSLKGGNGITAIIENIGTANATDIEWTLTIEGGLLIFTREFNGTIPNIMPGEKNETELLGRQFLGLGIGLGFIGGLPTITLTAECAEGSSDSVSEEARIILKSVYIIRDTRLTNTFFSSIFL